MKRCGKDCSACPYIREVKSLNINTNEWKINQNLNCEISNCIYLIECMKEHCNMKYVGKTKIILKFRLANIEDTLITMLTRPLVNISICQATPCLTSELQSLKKWGQMMTCIGKRGRGILYENLIPITRDWTDNHRIVGEWMGGFSHLILCKLLLNKYVYCMLQWFFYASGCCEGCCLMNASNMHQ